MPSTAFSRETGSVVPTTEGSGPAGSRPGTPAPSSFEAAQFVASARRVLADEIAGLEALAAAVGNGLGTAFVAAVETIRAAKGRVVVTGVGKSGHVGSKISSTLASTGTPSFFVHASEAGHGDLGMITGDDVVLALSWSGETDELAAIIAYAKRFRVPLIALTSKPGSTLGRAADIVIALPRVKEACPHGLAPTTSTVLQMAMGDAIAVALLEARGFTAQDFRAFHPGGRLGASLQLVRDLMHGGAALPLIATGSPMSEAIVLMSAKGFGCVGVAVPDGRLVGIITDGDLRRHLSSDLLEQRVEAVMSADPKTVPPHLLAASALEVMNTGKITAVFVVENGRAVGILHMHDLLRAGVA